MSNDKTKTVLLEVLYLKENNLWIRGGTVTQEQWSTLLKGFGARPVLQRISRDNTETGHNWLGEWGFLE